VTGLIETVRVRRGVMPLLSLHAARLARSIAALGIVDPGPLGARIGALPRMEERVIRVEAGPHGVHVTTRDVPAADPFTVAAVIAPYRPYPHKITERAQFTSARAVARAAGADDALLVTGGGEVAEGTTWSVFWWEGEGKGIATPPLALGVLPGVARERLSTLLSLIECRATVGALGGLSLFAANAVRGVVPILRLDGAPVPSDPRTAELAQAFWPT